jgi:cell division protein ZapA (FtsZ GTPase activity inhibitor)
MQVFVVTSKAQEKDTSGTILTVKVRVFGVFSNEDHANALADKYNASVKELTLDNEVTGSVIQSWLNPGYVD